MGLFNAGDRVFWYRFSSSSKIIACGYGTVISLKCKKQITIYEILIDGGKLENFLKKDLEPVIWYD